MVRKQRQKTVEIRQFIIDFVEYHPSDITQVTADRFGMSVQGVGHHLRKLVGGGILRSEGKTKARRYELVPRADIHFLLDIDDDLEEHIPWQKIIRPKLEGVPDNVLAVCNYGFTEMVNNAIDHSESDKVEIRCLYTAHSVKFEIRDFGIGVFKKIKEELKLNDERESILELSKGKLTTDPKRHSGEGIFFTSRMFDMFSMYSGSLYFSHVSPDSDWLIEIVDDMNGTVVDMTIALTSTTKPKDLYDFFVSSEDEITFSKTHVPLRLAQYGNDSLVSRSQARRVLARFEKFDEVILDMDGVEFIGQAFADEIFRVFFYEHPDTSVLALNANKVVKGMVNRAISARGNYQSMNSAADNKN